MQFFWFFISWTNDSQKTDKGFGLSFFGSNHRTGLIFKTMGCKVPCMIFILSVDMTYHLIFHSASMACREIVLKMTYPRRKTFLTNIGIAQNWPCQIIGLATQMNISVIQRAQASRYSKEQSKTVWPAMSNQNSLQVTGNNKDGYCK
jgi:hypothetical protein